MCSECKREITRITTPSFCVSCYIIMATQLEVTDVAAYVCILQLFLVLLCNPSHLNFVSVLSNSSLALCFMYSALEHTCYGFSAI